MATMATYRKCKQLREQLRDGKARYDEHHPGRVYRSTIRPEEFVSCDRNHDTLAWLDLGRGWCRLEGAIDLSEMMLGEWEQIYGGEAQKVRVMVSYWFECMRNGE